MKTSPLLPSSWGCSTENIRKLRPNVPNQPFSLRPSTSTSIMVDVFSFDALMGHPVVKIG